MKTSRVFLALFLIGSTLWGCSEPQEPNADTKRPQLTVSDSWMRQPIAGRDMSSAYVTIENSGTADDALISARSDMAARIEIHTTKMENGIASMKKMETAPVPMKQGLVMAPGGAHLMLFGLKKDFQAGEEIYMSLAFETSAPITIKIPIMKTAPKQE